MSTKRIRNAISGNYPYQVISRRKTRLGRFCVVQDTVLIDGKCYPFSFEESDDAVVVLPVLSDQVVLIYQYRHAIDEWVWELPSGGLSGDSPEAAARRELLEETGYVTDELVDLGSYYISEGKSSSKTFFFVAYCGDFVGQRCEPTEIIHTYRIPQDQLEYMIINHEIKTSGTVMAWQLFQMYGSEENARN